MKMVMKMRINNIIIKNYRQYKEEKLNFQNNNRSNLNIIIAKNGVGKTNILNAITWCLYDNESHLGSDSKSLPILNLNTLAELEEMDSVDVSVEIEILLEGVTFIVKRTANCVKNEEAPRGVYTKPSNFEVKKLFKDQGKTPEVYYDQEASQQISRLLPKEIHEYFFFDNEQLNSYFVENDSDTIRSAIHQLSQVELLSRARRHLSTIADEYRAKIKRNNPDLESKYAYKVEYEKKASDKKEEIDNLKKQIQTSKDIIKENKTITNKAPDIKSLSEELNELETKRDNLKANKKQNLTYLQQFIREYSTLLRLYPELKNTHDYIEEKQNKGEIPVKISKEILEDTVNGDTCKICGSELSEENEDHVKSLLEKIKFSNIASQKLVQIKSDIQRMMDKAESYPSERDKVQNDYQSVADELDETERRITEIKDTIKSRSDSEDLKKLLIEIEEQEGLLEQNRQKLPILQAEHSRLVEAATKAKDEYDKAVNKVDKSNELNKLVNLCEKALKVITESENELTQEMQQKTVEMTYETFSSLIWKKNTFKEVVINENYELDLIHNKGYPCIGSCSAAERSLLALSFTLSLHKISGINAPLVIDSPVGRVSDDSRENFAQVLANVSRSKQIIMFFTPSEYSDEVKETFKNKIGTLYYLDMQNDTESIIKKDDKYV